MEKGSVVKIRFRRYFKEQRLWVFVGKILEVKEGWIKVHGKGIVLNTGMKDPVDIDQDARTIYCPRDNIVHIRLLPDDFDLSHIETYQKGNRWFIKVNGAPDTSLGEGF